MLNNLLAQHALAAMLALATPGRSPHSRTVMPECGIDPTTSVCAHVRVCDKPGTLCQPAVWSKEHGGWTRQENEEEGLRRWAVIAEANAKAASEVSGWAGTKAELVDALVTTEWYESSFRGDVHSGVGPQAFGDCSTVSARTGRAVAAGTPGAVRRCRSGCLMQLNIESLRSLAAGEGWSARDLVGVTAERTDRCVLIGARHLARSRNMHRHGNWLAATMAAYGGLHNDARVATFGKVSRAPSSLPAAVLRKLGIEVEPREESNDEPTSGHDDPVLVKDRLVL